MAAGNGACPGVGLVARGALGLLIVEVGVVRHIHNLHCTCKKIHPLSDFSFLATHASAAVIMLDLVC